MWAPNASYPADQAGRQQLADELFQLAPLNWRQRRNTFATEFDKGGLQTVEYSRPVRVVSLLAKCPHGIEGAVEGARGGVTGGRVAFQRFRNPGGRPLRFHPLRAEFGTLFWRRIGAIQPVPRRRWRDPSPLRDDRRLDRDGGRRGIGVGGVERLVAVPCEVAVAVSNILHLRFGNTRPELGQQLGGVAGNEVRGFVMVGTPSHRNASNSN